jgi:hypothetical protein
MYFVQGEEVYGMFRLSPNGRNVRDLDIEIDVDFAVSFSRIFSVPLVSVSQILCVKIMSFKQCCGSGFNGVPGCGSVLAIRIQIQEGKNDPQK